MNRGGQICFDNAKGRREAGLAVSVVGKDHFFFTTAIALLPLPPSCPFTAATGLAVREFVMKETAELEDVKRSCFND